MVPWKTSAFLLTVCELLRGALGDNYMQTIYQGTISAGNFTYYKLSHRGNIQLVLESTVGDTDIYASSSTLSPTFDEYDMKSETCGEDGLAITSDMERPVGIGVFGHPFYEKSTFLLYVKLLPDDSDVYPEEQSYAEYSYDSSSAYAKPSPKILPKSSGVNVRDEEESILWTIVVGILKIVLDILV